MKRTNSPRWGSAESETIEFVPFYLTVGGLFDLLVLILTVVAVVTVVIAEHPAAQRVDVMQSAAGLASHWDATSMRRNVLRRPETLDELVGVGTAEYKDSHS